MQCTNMKKQIEVPTIKFMKASRKKEVYEYRKSESQKVFNVIALNIRRQETKSPWRLIFGLLEPLGLRLRRPLPVRSQPRISA